MPAQDHRDGERGATAQAEEWDARYGDRDGTMWSGRPNGRLLVEVASLTPGRALDVGCGEGADAIWLAGSGWTVTAIDVSEVAVGRAPGPADEGRPSDVAGLTNATAGTVPRSDRGCSTVVRSAT